MVSSSPWRSWNRNECYLDTWRQRWTRWIAMEVDGIALWVKTLELMSSIRQNNTFCWNSENLASCCGKRDYCNCNHIPSSSLFNKNKIEGQRGLLRVIVRDEQKWYFLGVKIRIILWLSNNVKKQKPWGPIPPSFEPITPHFSCAWPLISSSIYHYPEQLLDSSWSQVQLIFPLIFHFR